MHPRSPHLGALVPTQTCQGKINRQPTRKHRLPLYYACSLSRQRSAQSSNHDSPGVYAHRAVNIKGQELARQTMGNLIVIGNTFKVCTCYGTSRQPPPCHQPGSTLFDRQAFESRQLTHLDQPYCTCYVYDTDRRSCLLGSRLHRGRHDRVTRRYWCKVERISRWHQIGKWASWL